MYKKAIFEVLQVRTLPAVANAMLNFIIYLFLLLLLEKYYLLLHCALQSDSYDVMQFDLLGRNEGLSIVDLSC